MSNLPMFTNKRKATDDEQLEVAQRLPQQQKLPSFISDQLPEQLSSQDRINLQKEKLKEVGQIMSEPAEYDELDTSGYLPNQQMAGQGVWKAIRSALALQPKEEEYPTIGTNPITGKPSRIDPFATMGIIKNPKIIGEIVGSLPTNVNKKQLLDALEYKIGDKLIDQHESYRNLLDSSIRKYTKQKDLYKPEGGGYSGISTGDFHDDLIDSLYPGIKNLEQKDKIKILMGDLAGVGQGSQGTALSKIYKHGTKISVPEKISVKEFDDPSTLMHEAQHFEDEISNPFEFSRPTGYQDTYTANSFIKQLKDINPNINLLEKEIEGMPIRDVLIKHNVNPYDFFNKSHFTTPEYKYNYELEKALELLRENPRILESKGIENNFDLLQGLVNELKKQRITPAKAKQFLNERGFQSIDQLLKKK